MNYTEGSFDLSVLGDHFTFKGKIEKSDYSDLSRFLSNADKATAGDKLVFDFRGLEYLNSSGIRTIAVFFLETKKNVGIRINPDITWQKVGITPLTAIKPSGAIVVEA